MILNSFSFSVAQRKLQLQLDGGAQHIYICDHHKTMILMSRTRRVRRDTADNMEEEGNEVNLIVFVQVIPERNLEFYFGFAYE